MAYQVPVYNSNEEPTTNDVSKQGRDHRMGNVMPDTQSRSSQENAQRQVEHVGNNVIERQDHESERRPPDSNDLAEELPTHERQEGRQADQPVRANASEEDLMPLRRDGFRRRECDDTVVEGWLAKGTTIADDNCHDKERTGKVAPKGNEPMKQHLQRREAAMKYSDRRQLFRATLA